MGKKNDQEPTIRRRIEGDRDGGWTGSPLITEKEWKAIFEEAGVPYFEDFLGRLNSISTELIIHYDNPELRKKEIRRGVERIYHLADELRSSTENMPEAYRAYLDVYLLRPDPKNELLRRLQDDLTVLSFVAKEALNDIGIDIGGRPNERHLHWFIFQLGQIYWKATGKAPGITYNDLKEQRYAGQFFHFVELCLDHLGYDIHSNVSLGEAVKKGNKLFQLYKEENETA